MKNDINNDFISNKASLNDLKYFFHYYFGLINDNKRLKNISNEYIIVLRQQVQGCCFLLQWFEDQQQS